MAVNAALSATGLDVAANAGMDTIKGGLSETLGLLGMNKETAKELGSTLIDGIQATLAIKGGQMSNKVTNTKGVQKISNIAKQAKILKSIETKAASLPGATKATIKASVDAARPVVAGAKASTVSWGDVAQHNIKMLGYDVAANSALPLLGIAIESVKNGENKSIEDALESFAVNTATTLATAPIFKGFK